ncbi:MAG: hypothetical protein RMM29_00575 [Planctomycetota bacterium]|nr:hypothetical protein [Planctomycetota bacterium]MCX8039386.1 hypothetical protein [Planctomycetota bacterium]MDW8372129.1 hypothetical protein [Planctomycetota bacterium]
MKARWLLLGGLLALGAAQGIAWLAAPQREAAGLTAVPPGEFAGTLLLGGFRGLACDLLWLRAVNAKDAGRYYESVALTEAITRVQPRFLDVWQHLAHDLAYNIGFHADGAEQRYAWFVAGVRANIRGIVRNPESERLLRHLAWMFHHKGDQFHRQIEAHDWAREINPLLATVRALTGDRQAAADLPPGPGHSNFAIAHRLYTAAIALGEHAKRRGTGRVPAFVRRMVAHTLDADGNRLRNRGEHWLAVQRWLDACEVWDEVTRWMHAVDDDAQEMQARRNAEIVVTRNEGRVRRKAAELVYALAPEATAASLAAAAILERRWGEARQLLAQPGWKRTAGQVGQVVWLDEP